MQMFEKIKGWFGKEEPKQQQVRPDFGLESGGSAEAYGSYVNNHVPNTEYSYWNGEKNWGELGTVLVYQADYYTLSARCWQAYTESSVASLIINDYVKWVVGSGLRLESQPNTVVLKSEGINLTEEQAAEFSMVVESRFNLHANSRYSSYSRTESINRLAKIAFKTASLSGDALVIQRVNKKGGLNVEVMDGQRVVSPMLNTEMYDAATKRGNTIQNGIEMNPRGGHVAYYVRVADSETINPFIIKRIPAKGAKTGRTQAFMVYHNKYRIDYNRGVPLLSPVLELMGKLDRYVEATVGSAEERAKIVYFITHEAYSTGENPLLTQAQAARNAAGNGARNQDQNVGGLQNPDAALIATTSGKQTYNMPSGAELKALDSKTELTFKDFYDSTLGIILSSVGVPPEVAKKVFNSNYSASRMSVKTWEHTLMRGRSDFSFMYYGPIYNLFLELDILTGKVSAPGYLNALFSEFNHMILEAYRKARFVGTNVPSVDPLKEVKAARERMGSEAVNVPLSTPEQETEAVGLGEFENNRIKFKSQIKGFEVKKNTGGNNE